jgi:predicted kinase
MKSLIAYIFEKQNPFNAWIMCGLPGSGKSTYIKEELPKDIEIINQDSIRVELGIMDNVNDKQIGTTEQEKEVTRICLERIDKAIKDRRDFVIDNTNIKAGRVQNYYDKLKKANANVQIIIIDTPKEICKERRKEYIPEKVIDDMQLGLDKVKEKFKNNKDVEIIKNRY